MKVIFKSLVLVFVLTMLTMAIGALFELQPEQVKLLNIMTGVIIWATYTAPEMDKAARAKLKEVESREADRKKNEKASDDSDNPTP